MGYIARYVVCKIYWSLHGVEKSEHTTTVCTAGVGKSNVIWCASPLSGMLLWSVAFTVYEVNWRYPCDILAGAPRRKQAFDSTIAARGYGSQLLGRLETCFAIDDLADDQ